MAKGQLGGVAAIATVLDTPDEAAADPKIRLFYAAPNPVLNAVPFTFYWTTENVPNIRITGPLGYDSGTLPSHDGDFLAKLGGITMDSTFTISALDTNGDVIELQGAPVAQNLRVTLR